MRKSKWFILFFMIVMLGLPGMAQVDYCNSLDQSGLIFCDDFESEDPLTDRYFEVNNNNGEFGQVNGVGRDGSRGVQGTWQAGEVNAGGLLKSFGRTPSNYIGQHAAMPDSTFMEIYWKLDVRHQEGWQGNGPAKLCRAITLANANWATGAMAHLWSGGPGDQYLGMDPASGIDEAGNLVTTKYNDFANMRWLGWQYGNTPLFADQESGKWFCVEGHLKLNTPGAADGLFEFWINDTFQAGQYDINWHGNWNADPDNYGINALFINNYWNAGSPVEQKRYFDNVVIATERIGCPEPVTSMESHPSVKCMLKVNHHGFEWEIPTGLNGQIMFYSLLGQVVQSVETKNIGFCPFSTDIASGLWFYTLRVSNGEMISGSVLVP